MAIAFIGNIDDLVKPVKLRKWKKYKNKIFVLDANDPRDLRKPGKFKQEFSTSNGGIIM